MSKRGSFTTKLGVLLATVGSAVGLGNIWRFPFVTGQNGGGSFLLVYLLCILIIGIPVIMAEFIIGHKSKVNVVDAFRVLSSNKGWIPLGYMGVLTGFTIICYYGVVTGWTLEYIYRSLINSFESMNPDEFKSFFDNFIGNPVYPLLWTFVVFTIMHGVIQKGVSSGIEKTSKVVMPVLFLLMVVLAVRSLFLPGAKEGMKFLFYPDFSKLSATSILEAMGQAFFSLSLGMGALITYSSYFKDNVNITRTAFQVAALDTMVAIVSGIIIFPALFSFGYQPTEGPGLAFVVLPNVFQQLPGAYVWSLVFYIMLFFAAFTSLMSLYEVVTAFVHENFNISRRKASAFLALIFIVISVGSAYSQTFFNILDFTASTVFLPLGGMLIAVFVGWFLDKNIIYEELSTSSRIFVKCYMFLLRYVSPVGIFIVFVYGIYGKLFS